MATEPPRRRRQSPAVYRRRRIVVFAAILVVIGVVWLLIAQPWRGAASEGATPPPVAKTQDAATALPVPTGTPSPSSRSTPKATPTPSATVKPAKATAAAHPTAAPSPSSTAGAAACLPRDVTVKAATDKEAYATGQNPKLSIRLTNHGTTDCTLNVGTSTQVFTITSGSDTWWRSTDCQSKPSDMVVLLAAGQTVSSAAPLVWDRTRSAVGTCSDPHRPRAPGGGASYHLSVEVGGISSDDTAQILLY